MSIEDVLAFAAVLGVAPVHLIVPLEDKDARVQITPGRAHGKDPIVSTPRNVREWIRGRGHVTDTPLFVFYDQQPEHEKDAMVKQSEDASAPGAALTRKDLTPSKRDLLDRPNRPKERKR